MTIGRQICIYLLVFAIPCLATAQETSSKPPQTPSATSSVNDDSTVNLPQLLQSITVTATREPEELKDVPNAVTVLTSDAIDKRQAQTPNQMLSEEPGIYSVRVASQGSPIIRGQIGNRVLYLWDGIRINNGALFAGPNPFFNQIPLNAVDHMEVVRGPGAVQYGSDAIGGVINIISRSLEPDRTLSSPKFGGDFTTRFGTVDTERSLLGNLWFASRKVSFVGGGTGQLVDDYRTPIGVMRNTGFKAGGGSFSFAFAPANGQTVRLSWIHDRRFDVSTYTQSKLNPGGIPRIFGPFEQRGLLKLTYSVDQIGKWSNGFNSYFYYQYYDSARDFTIERTDTLERSRTDTQQRLAGGGIQNINLIRGQSIIYGADYRSEDLNSDRTLFATTKATGSVAQSLPNGNVPAGTYKVFDAFVLSTLRPSTRWTASLGTRFESTHLRSFPRPQDPVAPFTLESLRLNKRWNAVTWNAGAVLHVVGGLGIAANVAAGFRAPTFSDTLFTGVPVFASGVASVPSPGVKPERSVTYEIGPRFVTQNLHMTVTAYTNQLTDLLTSVPAGTINIPGIGVVNALARSNIATAHVRGLEAALAYRMGTSWMVSTNATVTRGQDTFKNLPLPKIPPAFGTLGLRWAKPSARWWAEAALVLVDRLRRHGPEDELDAGFSRDPAFGSPSPTNPPWRPNFQIPGYAVMNVRVGVSLYKESRTDLQLQANINNLFNVRYREAYSQQQLLAPGTGAVLGLHLRF